MKFDRDKLLNHLNRFVGTTPIMAKHMKAENGLPEFDVLIYRANNGRPYHILATVGLSSYKMYGKSKRVELLLYLDKNWNLFSEKEEFVWVYKLMQELPMAFKSAKKSFDYGQTYITMGSNTFSPSTEMNSAVLYYPVGLDNDSWQLSMGAMNKINFYLLTTATYREYAIIRKIGGLSFVKNYLLEEGDLEGLVVYNKKYKEA